MPPALPFNATQIIKSEVTGLVCYEVQLGQDVTEGELIANILLLDGPEAYRVKVPIYAGTSGIVFYDASKIYLEGSTYSKDSRKGCPTREDWVLLEAR